MAQKKKAQIVARSAGSAGKRAAGKAAAVTKRPVHSQSKAKPVARKVVAKPAAAKVAKSDVKTAGTVAAVKSPAKAAVKPAATVKSVAKTNLATVRAVAAAMKPAGQKITAPVAQAAPKSVVSPLYFAGARMLTFWPVSIVTHGLGLNITVQSYCGSLDFGLIAASQVVPDIDKLVRALHAALEELKSCAPTCTADLSQSGSAPRSARRGARVRA